MRKKRAFFLLLLLALFLFGAFFHHHADGCLHKDCLVCSQSIQNGVYLFPIIIGLYFRFFPFPYACLSFFYPPSFDLNKVISIRAPPLFSFLLS